MQNFDGVFSFVSLAFQCKTFISIIPNLNKNMKIQAFTNTYLLTVTTQSIETFYRKCFTMSSRSI